MRGIIKKLYCRGFREYKILSKISDGGMSKVYRAVSRVTTETFALKILFPAYASQRISYERLFQEKQVEGEIAASLVHPNVVRTHGFGKTRAGCYFVMEYVDGPTLKYAIHRNPRMLKGRKLEIISQAAKSLQYIHSKGVIHRDVSSKNMLVTGDGKLKLIDFGLAIAKAASNNFLGGRSGTPSYMAPEQIRAMQNDEKTDIYSFGIVMYEVLSGRMPFPGGDNYSKMHHNLNYHAVDLKDAVPGIDPRLSKIVSTCMRKKPEDRYGSMTSLLKDLRECAAR